MVSQQLNDQCRSTRAISSVCVSETAPNEVLLANDVKGGPITEARKQIGAFLNCDGRSKKLAEVKLPEQELGEVREGRH